MDVAKINETLDDLAKLLREEASIWDTPEYVFTKENMTDLFATIQFLVRMVKVRLNAEES